MIFIYLTSFRNKNREGPISYAVYGGITPNFCERREYLERFTIRSKDLSKLKAIEEILPTLPQKEIQDIMIFSGEHKLAWDYKLIRAGKSPEFHKEKTWEKFLNVLDQNNISPAKIIFREGGGLMSESEKAMAQCSIEAAAKSEKSYEQYL